MVCVQCTHCTMYICHFIKWNVFVPGPLVISGTALSGRHQSEHHGAEQSRGRTGPAAAVSTGAATPRSTPPKTAAAHRLWSPQLVEAAAAAAGCSRWSARPPQPKTARPQSGARRTLSGLRKTRIAVRPSREPCTSETDTETDWRHVSEVLQHWLRAEALADAMRADNFHAMFRPGACESQKVPLSLRYGPKHIKLQSWVRPACRIYVRPLTAQAQWFSPKAIHYK